MIDYVDPIPPVIRLLKPLYTERFYGNNFPSTPSLPAILVRNAGGLDYTRLQLLVRGNSDIEAMYLLIDVMNTLEANAARIEGLRGVWIERESNPIASVDQDTGKPEVWVYLRMEHLEA